MSDLADKAKAYDDARADLANAQNDVLFRKQALLEGQAWVSRAQEQVAKALGALQDAVKAAQAQ
jgi:hypothetical protein